MYKKIALVAGLICFASSPVIAQEQEKIEKKYNWERLKTSAAAFCGTTYLSFCALSIRDFARYLLEDLPETKELRAAMWEQLTSSQYSKKEILEYFAKYPDNARYLTHFHFSDIFKKHKIHLSCFCGSAFAVMAWLAYNQKQKEEASTNT